MIAPIKTPVVLFTSAGRRVELLRGFRRAYQSLGLVSQIIAVDIDPLAPALQEADVSYLVPRLTSSEYVPTLLDICQRQHVDLIFPLIDPDIGVLAAHRSAFQAVGAQIAAVSLQAAEITADKWLTMSFFQSLDLRIPQSWLPGQVHADELDYPVFMKPRRGSAGEHTFQVRNAKELAFFSDYIPDAIIQEYLPGPEITNDIICGLDGEILAVISRQRIEVRSGEVTKGVTIHNPAILEACIKIAQTLPAIGPITVQCMMKQGVPHYTEINARLGGGIPLALAAGVDSPRWLLARAAGIPIDIPPLGTYQVGLSITRFHDSFFLTDTDRERMASRCI